MAERTADYTIAVKNAEQALAKLKEFGDAGERAFTRITKAAKGTEEVPRSLRALDAGLVEVRGHLDELASRAGVFGQIAQAAGPLGIAAAAVVGVGAALTGLSFAAADSAGKLVDLADLTGVATDTLQAYRIAAAGVGIEQGQLDQAFQTFTKNVGDAELGTGRFASKLKALDPAFLATVTGTASVEEAFELTVAKIQELPSAAERASLATAAFGAEGAKLALVGGTVDEVVQKYREAGAVIGDDVLRAADAAGDAFDEVSLILDAQVRAILTENAPAFITLATTAVSAAGSIVEAFRNVLEVLGVVSQSQEEQLRVAREQLNFQETARASAERGGAGETSLAAYDAQIAKQKEIIQQLEATAFARKEAAAADAKAAKDAIAAEQERLRQIKLGEEAAKKAAREAEAAGKKRAADAKTLSGALAQLETDVWDAGLEGIAKLDAERDVAYAKWAEQAEALGATEEEVAQGNLAIWERYERERTALMEEEAEKRATAAQKEAEKAAKEAEKASQKQAAAAEKAAQEMERPFENAFENVQGAISDAFVGAFDGSLSSAEDFADSLLSIFVRLAAEIATLMVIRPVLGGITGTLGGAAGLSGGQDSFSLLNFFTQTNKASGGLSDLWSGLKQLGGAVSDVSGLFSTFAGDFGSIGGLTQALSGATAAQLGGISFGAGGLSAAEAALLFPNGAVPASFAGSAITASGSTVGAGVGLAGIGASIGSAAGTAGIAYAAIAAIATASAIAELNKQPQFYNIKGYTKALQQSLGSIAKPADAFLSIFGTSGPEVYSSAYGITHGKGFSGNTVADITAVLDPIAMLLSAFINLPTKGTALRKRFEEYIEDKDLNAGFFARNSGTFQRGIGQEGTRDILRAQYGTDKDLPDGAFADAMRQYNAETAKAIGLTEEQAKQVTGLSVAFRAMQGAAAGNEEQRGLAVAADLLGSIAAEGASAAETLEIVKKAIEGLGDPRQVFRALNDFATSKDNDIAPEDLAAAYEGLADALFGDLPGAVDAADLALEEFTKNGIVDFEELTKRVANVTAAGNLLVGVLSNLSQAIAVDPDAFFAKLYQGATDGNGEGVFREVVSPEAIDRFHDAILIAFRDATVQGLTQALIEGALKPTLLEPFIAKNLDIFQKVQSGEITGQQGSELLAANAAELEQKLKDLDPFLRDFILAIAGVSKELNALIGAADNAADAVAAFNDSIQDQLLQLRDPDAAELQALERAQAERRKQAEEIGADLTALAALEAEERAALLKRQHEDELRELERIADEKQRIVDQELEQWKRAQEQVLDLITSLTASPSSPLPPQQAFGAAQAEFAALAAAARGGDTDALEKLPQAAQSLLGLAEVLFGSTQGFFDVFGPVLATLEELTGKGLGPTLSPGDQAIVDALDQQTRDLIAAMQDPTPGTAGGSTLYTGKEVQGPGPSGGSSLYTGHEVQGPGPSEPASDWLPLQQAMQSLGSETVRGNAERKAQLEQARVLNQRMVQELAAVRAAVERSPSWRGGYGA